MYTFRREEKINQKTNEPFNVDHYEMRSGEKRILSNGTIQEDVKAGHVEPGMLLDPEFKKAYDAFVVSQTVIPVDVFRAEVVPPLLLTEGVDPVIPVVVEGDKPNEE